MLPHNVHLLNLISAAVTPVVLISSVAILMGAIVNKYVNVAAQIRLLTGEFRDPSTTMTRSKSIEKQIHLFYRRITALWLITAMLFGSILCFMITIFSVIFWQNGAGIGIFGAGSLVFGLLLITSAILTELYEIVLARKTIRQEMEDIFTPK